jgi:UV DNA damage endonuclease
MNRLGYCCINLSLEKEKVTPNRGMIKKTFIERGIEYASELSLLNIKDLKKILLWNIDNGIRMYRMSSDMFPWVSEYEIQDLPDFIEIQLLLKDCGSIAKSNDLRLTFHPSPYSVLASDRIDVYEKAYKEIKQHCQIMDLMDLERTFHFPVNIHVNTSKPTKEEALNRFIHRYLLLDDSIKSRLVLEIDDKSAGYNVKELFGVYEKCGIPITFDYLHNKCYPSDLDEESAIKLAISTWPKGIIPLTHYSESKKKFEDTKARISAHSDWINEDFSTYGLEIDIELEVKQKDLALLKYLEEYEM